MWMEERWVEDRKGGMENNGGTGDVSSGSQQRRRPFLSSGQRRGDKNKRKKQSELSTPEEFGAHNERIVATMPTN